MIDEQEATTLVDSILLSVRGYVDKVGADFRAYVEERIKAIPAGPQGPQGVPGESVKGEQGIAGKDAPAVDLVKLAANVVSLIPTPRDGAIGPQGPRGERGSDGLTTIGETGPAGPQGVEGIRGKDGLDGKDGKDGAPGIEGRNGEKGIDGKDGRDGREGKDGRDGANGRDALDIEILPAVDESKAYPRGTWAQYKGGIAKFDGVSWKVLIEGPAEPRGIASVELADTDDPRVKSVHIKFTDGMVDSSRIRFKGIQLFKGVHESGTYEQGDTVTHGGSQWVCTVESTKETPGASHDWQLSVKRGKDGKSITGPQGETGAPGRDLRYQ